MTLAELQAEVDAVLEPNVSLDLQGMTVTGKVRLLLRCTVEREQATPRGHTERCGVLEPNVSLDLQGARLSQEGCGCR